MFWVPRSLRGPGVPLSPFTEELRDLITVLYGRSWPDGGMVTQRGANPHILRSNRRSGLHHLPRPTAGLLSVRKCALEQRVPSWVSGRCPCSLLRPTLPRPPFPCGASSVIALSTQGDRLRWFLRISFAAPSIASPAAALFRSGSRTVAAKCYSNCI